MLGGDRIKEAGMYESREAFKAREYIGTGNYPTLQTLKSEYDAALAAFLAATEGK